jgi:hypothetical protein
VVFRFAVDFLAEDFLAVDFLAVVFLAGMIHPLSLCEIRTPYA